MLKAETKNKVLPALLLNTILNLRSLLLGKILVNSYILHRHLAVMSLEHISTAEKKMRLYIMLKET